MEKTVVPFFFTFIFEMFLFGMRRIIGLREAKGYLWLKHQFDPIWGGRVYLWVYLFIIWLWGGQSLPLVALKPYLLKEAGFYLWLKHQFVLLRGASVYLWVCCCLIFAQGGQRLSLVARIYLRLKGLLSCSGGQGFYNSLYYLSHLIVWAGIPNILLNWSVRGLYLGAQSTYFSYSISSNSCRSQSFSHFVIFLKIIIYTWLKESRVNKKLILGKK